MDDTAERITHLVVVVDDRADAAGGHVTVIEDARVLVAFSSHAPIVERCAVLGNIMASQLAQAVD